MLAKRATIFVTVSVLATTSGFTASVTRFAATDILDDAHRYFSGVRNA